MTNKRKKTNTPSLSSENTSVKSKKKGMTDEQVKELNDKVFLAVNNLELQKSLDRWLRENSQNNTIVRRDLTMLKNMVSEYLDSFVLFGYNMEGERVIIQKFETSKDRDAVMEFLKTIFLKQQHENFLDE